jgi:hypothetical protein
MERPSSIINACQQQTIGHFSSPIDNVIAASLRVFLPLKTGAFCSAAMETQ